MGMWGIMAACSFRGFKWGPELGWIVSGNVHGLKLSKKQRQTKAGRIRLSSGSEVFLGRLIS
jgi:hypothetical protein